jgi:hypothetical protein
VHVAPRGTSVRAVGGWLVCLALVLTSFAVAPGARAAESCRTTPDDPTAPTYTVTVCVSLPDGPLSGVVGVSSQVYVTPVTTASPPAVKRVVFWFDGGYLLTDFDPAYGMAWRTSRLPDGTGTFEVRARTGDGRVSRVEVPVTLANGPDAAQPPAVEPFRARTGTAPQPGRRFRLVAVGDGVDGSAREEQVAARIADSAPNLLAYLGDVYQRGSPFEFDTWYAGPGGYGRFRDITNPVVGNHEYQTPGAAGYFGFWGGVPHYYSYDVAGWHVVALDSTRHFEQLQPGTPQYDWLAADLGANRSRCTIVYMHHPRYSVAGHRGRTRLRAVWSLLAARRVTLALTGHAHAYQRWVPLDGNGAVNPGGVTQMVAGAGGREVKPVFAADARVATALSVQGALRLDLGADDAEFSYVDEAGAVLDAGSVGCKSTGDPLPPTVPRGLRVTAQPPSTAHLSWLPSTDQYTAVAGYTVRRNGLVVATVAGGTASLADTGLTAGKSYSWTVSAFDTSDNHSAESSAAATTLPAGDAVRASSRRLLRSLAVRKERNRGFAEKKFRTWLDADADSCTTRSEVLLAESRRAPTVRAGCRVTAGRWLSRLDGVRSADLSRLRIEHLVPLREAWASGARRWAGVSRAQLANDLGYRSALNVSTKRVLRARGSAEPQRWMPPRRAARCTYVAQWVAVKWRWGLTVDRGEKRFLTQRLTACGWPKVERPRRPTVSRR